MEVADGEGRKWLMAPAGSQAADQAMKISPFLRLVVLTAASAGFLFGYDLGISGGVTSMDDFLLKFFPTVYEKKNDAKTSNYCKFDSQLLTLFTSSLFLASLLSSFVASMVTQKFGRKPSILVGGFLFLTGAIVDGAAQNLSMLIIGRIILGFGLGFTNQAVPLYLSEMSPTNVRGKLTTMFQVASAIGSTFALVVNAITQSISPWGWRLSLSLGALPASIVTIGFVFLPESPSSLIERGHLDEGLHVLRRVRGRHDVQEEFDELVQAIDVSKEIKKPWRTILKRRYRPQLVMAFAIPFFQQVTGVNIISFYAPIMFQTFGFNANTSLYSVITLGVITIIANIVTAFSVDKLGRRKLFLLGGCTMFILEVIIGLVLQLKLGAHNSIPKGYGITCLLLVYLFALSFGLSWAPLAWLVPSEIFPLEIRSAGQSVNISVSMFFFFASAQAMLGMLCFFKASTFFFFSGWVFIMTVFTYTLLPETKGVSLDNVVNLWKKHPIWRRCYIEQVVEASVK